MQGLDQIEVDKKEEKKLGELSGSESQPIRSSPNSLSFMPFLSLRPTPMAEIGPSFFSLFPLSSFPFVALLISRGPSLLFPISQPSQQCPPFSFPFFFLPRVRAGPGVNPDSLFHGPAQPASTFT